MASKKNFIIKIILISMIFFIIDIIRRILNYFFPPFDNLIDEIMFYLSFVGSLFILSFYMFLIKSITEYILKLKTKYFNFKTKFRCLLFF